MDEGAVIQAIHELKASVSSQVDDLKNQFETKIEKLASVSIENAESTRKELSHVRRHMIRQERTIQSLWATVKGSDPPPPPPEDLGTSSFPIDTLIPVPPNTPTPSFTPRPRPLDEQVDELEKKHEAKTSEFDLELVALRGEMIGEFGRVHQRVNDMESTLAKTRKDVGTTLTVNQKQAQHMGIVDKKGQDVRGFKYLFTRSGMKDVAVVLAGVTSLVTAIGTCYALITGRLPMPSDPPHGQPSSYHQASP